MYKRLNITLPDDVLARADEFARSHRFSRSGLIAEALETLVAQEAASSAEVAEEAPAHYGAGSAVLTTAIADAMGGRCLCRTPLTPDIILAELEGRPLPFGRLDQHVG